jgi:hypothetical protein
VVDEEGGLWTASLLCKEPEEEEEVRRVPNPVVLARRLKVDIVDGEATKDRLLISVLGEGVPDRSSDSTEKVGP